MTELSNKILNTYQARKTSQQKQAFIDLLKQYFPQLQIQEGGFPKCRNLIIGDVENAKVLLSAHYDTCAKIPIPNFITPKAPIISILYSILILVPVFAVVLGLNVLLLLLTDSYPVHFLFSLIASFALLTPMFIGPANKHTANDNTSGVITLCELALQLSEQERSKVAFLFFDNEELGMLGSSLFRSRCKEIAGSKLLINFDCVSDGDHILVAASKSARIDHGAALDIAFVPSKGKTVLLCNSEKIYYPSDQAVFKKSVAIAALNKKPFIGYYMDKIHTNKDTVFDKANIKLLCECVLRFIKQL